MVRERDAGLMSLHNFFQTRKSDSQSATDKSWVLDSLFISGAIFLLILVRPFGLNQVNFMLSALYWALICVIGFCVYSLTYWIGRKTLTSHQWKYPLPLVILTLVAGLLMTLLVPILSSMFFGHPLSYTSSIFIVLPQTLVIGAIIILATLTKDYIRRQNDRLNLHAFKQKQLNTAPNFMKKLPRKLQGELLCINSEDHYLNVYTDKGRFMLKMRFSDAILELEDLQGLRVHRSWWVSENAVLDAQKTGRKVSLLLRNNISVPISRSNLKQAKERGLL